MDISSYFTSLIEEFRSVAEAEKEFRRQMDDDPLMHKEYEDWCAENEYTPRTGLREFGTTYIEERESKWDTLNDYDEMQ